MGKQTKVLTSFPKVTGAIFNKLSLFSTPILCGLIFLTFGETQESLPLLPWFRS